MSALLDCTSSLQHNNIIGFSDSREAMGDGNSRTTLCDPIESELDDLFALRINSTGGFIEDDDLRFLDYASCDGDSLLLSSGKFHSTVADFCVVTLLAML
jgi:hypothetical protein